MSRVCPKCKVGTDFYPNKAHANGLSSWCKSCDKIFRKMWKQKNKELLKNKFYSIINREKMKPCLDCGIQYSPWIMQFDHREPLKKTINVGLMQGYPLEKILLEISKCDVVCANCHAERTHKQFELKKAGTLKFRY